MKTLVLSTALISALAAPVLAGTSSSDIFLQDALANNEVHLFVADGVSSAPSIQAISVFAAETASEDGLTGSSIQGNEVVSTQSFGGNTAAAAIFAAEAAANLENN